MAYSTIWAVLSAPNPAAGCLPFVDSDNASIITDVLNLKWDNTLKRLHVKTAGDYTGDSTLNAYGMFESYLSQASQTLITGSAVNATEVSGFAVSSSRGTGSTPLNSQTGDFIGKFSAWGYFNAAAYEELAGMFAYAVGATSGDVGGELHFFTKQDAGSMTDFLTLDSTGNLKPTTAGVAGLGAAGLGFKRLNLDYTISSGVGAQTINKPCGSFKWDTGTSVTITNSLVTGNSIVICVLQTEDATMYYIRRVVPGAGSFTVHSNAAPTAQVTVAFLVINTDS